VLIDITCLVFDQGPVLMNLMVKEVDEMVRVMDETFIVIDAPLFVTNAKVLIID